MSITIVQYQSRDELKTAHPELKNLTVVHQCGTRETLEETITALRKKQVQGAYTRLEILSGKKRRRCPLCPGGHLPQMRRARIWGRDE